jgi:hypothetical protein
MICSSHADSASASQDCGGVPISGYLHDTDCRRKRLGVKVRLSPVRGNYTACYHVFDLVVATVTTTTNKGTKRVKMADNDSDDDCNGSQDLYCDLCNTLFPSIPLKTIVAETLGGLHWSSRDEDLASANDLKRKMFQSVTPSLLLLHGTQGILRILQTSLTE